MIVPVTAKPIGVGSGASWNPPARKTALATRGTSAATSTVRRWVRKPALPATSPTRREPIGGTPTEMREAPSDERVIRHR
jgi:hypothetical protein